MAPADGGEGTREHEGALPPAGGDVPAGTTSPRRPPGRRGVAASTGRQTPRTLLVGVAGTGLGLLLGGLLLGGQAPTPAPGAEAATPVPTVTVTRAAPPRVLNQASAVADPTRLVVPSLGIDQDLIDLGLTQDGALEVPHRPADIGWWAGGPAPGDPGGAVIAAHVRLGGEPAAFLDLSSMEEGQKIVVGRGDGSSATYRVTSVEEFAKDDFPRTRVYTDRGPSQLRLITCGGDIDETTGHYLDNVVVFADLVPPAPTEEDDPDA